MTIGEQIRDIKVQLRLVMNGVAAQGMRDRGICYKLNFGASILELVTISKDYTPSLELALALWKDDIRECRMLAAMLAPADCFTEDLADFWVSDIRYPDLAEVCSRYLFVKLPYASVMAFRWIAQQDAIVQYCGYLILTQLLRQGRQISDSYRQELTDQCQAALAGSELLPRRGAMAALQALEENHGEGSDGTAE